jgi:hypothetical protein
MCSGKEDKNRIEEIKHFKFIRLELEFYKAMAAPVGN